MPRFKHKNTGEIIDAEQYIGPDPASVPFKHCDAVQYDHKTGKCYVVSVRDAAMHYLKSFDWVVAETMGGFHVLSDAAIRAMYNQVGGGPASPIPAALGKFNIGGSVMFISGQNKYVGKIVQFDLTDVTAQVQVSANEWFWVPPHRMKPVIKKELKPNDQQLDGARSRAAESAAELDAARSNVREANATANRALNELAAEKSEHKKTREHYAPLADELKKLQFERQRHVSEIEGLRRDNKLGGEAYDKLLIDSLNKSNELKRVTTELRRVTEGHAECLKTIAKMAKNTEDLRDQNNALREDADRAERDFEHAVAKCESNRHELERLRRDLAGTNQKVVDHHAAATIANLEQELRDTKDTVNAVCRDRDSHKKRADEFQAKAKELKHDREFHAKRADSVETELRQIDEILSRRPSLADKPTRVAKIEFAINTAKQADEAWGKVALLRAEVDAYKRAAGEADQKLYLVSEKLGEALADRDEAQKILAEKRREMRAMMDGYDQACIKRNEQIAAKEKQLVDKVVLAEQQCKKLTEDLEKWKKDRDYIDARCNEAYQEIRTLQQKLVRAEADLDRANSTINDKTCSNATLHNEIGGLRATIKEMGLGLLDYAQTLQRERAAHDAEAKALKEELKTFKTTPPEDLPY